jgi:hypothetical protein
MASKLTMAGNMSASSSMSALPTQSTFRSSLMPSTSLFVVFAFDSCKGTGPRSILVKCRVFNGPGSMVLNMGSTISLIILLPAALMLGHNSFTMSFRNSALDLSSGIGAGLQLYVLTDRFTIARSGELFHDPGHCCASQSVPLSA